MRIQRVRFKNLNSLVEEWDIDLTHPAFSADGIFAITGPTGAGKTTILDAVCLALYGRTPRLTKVTKSGNEIMSRQTGDCFAEVTFETQTGRFRCHWSQHRARKKPDGDLQAPRHEIADADSGRILETKILEVAKQIETATGMDFERFTRSMLLAQGGFAAFLQAAPDDRAPILEQVTGTEIYSLISIRVHERRSEERKKLETLLSELAGMQVLSDEDERRLVVDLEQKTIQDTEVGRRIALTSQAVAWLDGIARLEGELEIIEKQNQDWQTRHEAFAPEYERLRRAMTALELAGEHAGLASIRREQEAERYGLGEILEAIPMREEALQRAEEAVKQAGELFETLKKEQKEALPGIRKAREIDLRIREKDAPIKGAEDSVAELEKSINELNSLQVEDCRNLEAKKRALEDVLRYLEENRVDEGLVEHLTWICGRFDALRSLRERQLVKMEEVKGAEMRVAQTTRIFNEICSDLETRRRGLEDIQGQFTDRQLALVSVLEGRDPADWRADLSALSERKSLLEEVCGTVRACEESKGFLGELEKRRDALVIERANLATQLQVLLERHSCLEREMGRLETQLSLIKKIQGFEEARHQLRDGQPCPLCGAMVHPFAEGIIPATDETSSALATVRAELKTVSEAVANVKVKQAEVSKDLEQITIRSKECVEKISKSEALISKCRVDLGLDGHVGRPQDLLQRLQNENADSLDHAAKLVQTADAMEKELVTLRGSLEMSRGSVTMTERDMLAAAHSRDSAGELHDRVCKEADALNLELNTTLSGLRREMAAYGIEALSMDILDRLGIELAERRDRWVTRQKERLVFEQQIASLEVKALHQQKQILHNESELKTRRHLLAALQGERDTLLRERYEVFGDRNPDDEEARLLSLTEAAERDLDSFRELFSAAFRERSTLKNRQEGIETSIAARSAQLKSAEDLFLFRLNSLGFADEADYLAACLPEEERTTLMRQARKLADEQTGLVSMGREKTTKLETEQRKQITNDSRDGLEHALSGLVVEQKELQQSIGGIQQRLADNENRKQQQRDRILAIEAQKRECSRWDLLHDLIGSADGKKYRNFAQGLTFEMMIGHANRQLRKMSDRYLLIRDDAQPLELNVIDDYQAGEIRSTKNLSGGESFIVSLSLALGLSHMASKNVRVDSLFLDEGFGTLDEEALDTALETLASLRQDGKLIGVISHVSALKERIGTQIQVIPRTGGRSVIVGPGIRRE